MPSISLKLQNFQIFFFNKYKTKFITRFLHHLVGYLIRYNFLIITCMDTELYYFIPRKVPQWWRISVKWHAKDLSGLYSRATFPVKLGPPGCTMRVDHTSLQTSLRQSGHWLSRWTVYRLLIKTPLIDNRWFTQWYVYYRADGQRIVFVIVTRYDNIMPGCNVLLNVMTLRTTPTPHTPAVQPYTRMCEQLIDLQTNSWVNSWCWFSRRQELITAVHSRHWWL